jgi:predicted HTH transcriptional regulator
MTLEDLDILREGWAFEAKLASGADGRGELPASLWETYSAFANTNGGIIVLGLAENRDGTFDIRGIADIDKVERDLWNTVNNRQKVSANLLTQSSIAREQVEGRTLLVIRVPKAPRSQRPVHLNGSWETKTYVRLHDGDRIASSDVARRMLADAHPERDSSVIDGYTEADLDPESIRRYRNVLGSKRPEHPFLAEDDRAFLRQIGALRSIREKNADGLTLGGLLVLGREQAIRERFPHWHLSYRELPGDPSAGPRWVDRISSDGTWNANLFEFYNRIVIKLYQGLKVPFALDADQYRQDETAAHRAVREAFVNTLIHADFEGRGGIRVLRDPSGFEFINPGLLLVTVDQVWKGGVSEPRNPTVQRLFGLLQLGEREGSGGPTIRRAWADQHWRAPDLVEDVENTELHLKLRQVSLLPEESVAAVRDVCGASFDAQDELGRLALVTAHSEGGLTHAQLAALTDAHPRDVTLKLQDLVRRGLLVGSGRPRSMRYRLRSRTEGGTAGTVKSSDTSSPTSDTSSPSTVKSSDTSSPTSEESSEESSATSEESSEESSATSEETRGWKPMEKQLDAVVALCVADWRTLPEISAALGRQPSTVRTMYLRPLLERGALVRKYPDQPNHPHQAYRAANPAPPTPRSPS